MTDPSKQAPEAGTAVPWYEPDNPPIEQAPAPPDGNDHWPRADWPAPPAEGLSAEKQLEKEWLAQKEWLDYRNWLQAQVLALREQARSLQPAEGLRPTLSPEQFADLSSRCGDVIEAQELELIALREQARSLEEAIRDIAEPMIKIQAEAKRDGMKINGIAANELCNNTNWLRDKARAALKQAGKEKA
jgi:hypothetical protein